MATERELPDWIDGYLEFVKHTEPPLSYHIWTALGVISAALERKVHMKWGHETIYPNQYIVLVGPAGMSRKGVALSIGEDFLSRLEIPMGSQKLSKEAFYRAMNKSVRSYVDGDTGKLEYHSSMVTISKELIVFMGSKDSDFLAALTDLYDSHARWTYETKNMGVDRLIGVCFTMLGGTTPELFNVMLPTEALGTHKHDEFLRYCDTGKLEYHSSMVTISKELIVFMGSKDSDFLAALTDLYDSHARWTYETKNMGVDRLIGVCFTMLGGTTPELFNVMLPTEALGGGWASRTMFIVEQQKGKTDALPTRHPEDIGIRNELDRDLERINLLTGEIAFTEKAETLYETWYNNQEAEIRKGRWPVEDPRFASYTSRRATHIKKICMALSASRGDDMLIHSEDFERATSIIEAAEKKMPRAFLGFKDNVYS